MGSAHTAGHFGKEPQSNQRALAPPLGASPRLGMPAVRHCSVGPPRSAIHGRVAATPASCRGAHCAIPACGHRGLTGRLRSKARSKAEQQQQQSQSAKLHSLVGAGKPAPTRGTRTLRRSGRLSGRLALLVILILGAPLNHAGRNPILIWGVNRQDAGLAALGHGWPIAAAPQINVGLRACRA